MPGLSPVSELAKLPVPVPSDVVLLAVVGLGEVLKQTPLTVTEAPPFEVTSPPLAAVVDVTLLAAVVVSVGTVEEEAVVKDTSFPYAVPTLFVA
ncbi:MAG: hypothetical protein GY841_16455 [FCB group bacterium]|nr:hypothetical protein [FCB group bacterium]